MGAGFRESRRGSQPGIERLVINPWDPGTHILGSSFWQEVCISLKCERIEAGGGHEHQGSLRKEQPGTKAVGNLLRVKSRDHFQNEELQLDSLARSPMYCRH